VAKVTKRVEKSPTTKERTFHVPFATGNNVLPGLIQGSTAALNRGKREMLAEE